MPKYFFIVLLLLLNISKSEAQTLAKLKTTALELFNAGKYRQSLELLQQFQQQKGDDREVLRALGISAYHANKIPLAKQFLLLLGDGNSKKVDPSVFLYLGKTLHADLEFKAATKAYKEFLRRAKDDDPNRKTVIGNIKKCAAGLHISRQPELALVENLGENVNSLHDEFAPVSSPNFDEKIYFSAAREDAEGGLRNEECLPDEKKGKYISDIYFTAFENGDWITPEHLTNGLINSSRHEVLLDFTNKGKTMYFFRGITQYSGSVLVDNFKAENELRDLPPQFKGPLQAEIGDNSLHFFNDSILVFSSRRADGFGGLDLYFSIFRDNNWTIPRNLGGDVNSAYDETTPYLAKDGRTIYFSSNSPQSMGGFDVFKATYDEDSLRFLKPTNLGVPINSAGDDAYFRLTPDGMKAYFSSDRKDSYGDRDIYTALFKNFQKEQTLASPIAFHLVEDVKQKLADAAGNTPQAVKILTYTFAPIYYENDDDILRGVNLTQVKYALELIKKFPNLKVIFTTHSSEGEKPSFDLYFSTKRTEKIAKYLIDNGLQNQNIIIKSVGAAYPIAKIFIDGNPNPAGEKMNRRIDISIQNITNEPLKIVYEDPVVSQFMINPAGEKLKKHAKGLSYKIQILTTKRIYDNDILAKYGDSMMEAAGNEGVYQYSVGLSNDFSTADKMRQELLKEGIREAWVVPYVDGVRVIGDEAKQFTNKYGDLKNYLAYKKRP